MFTVSQFPDEWPENIVTPLWTGSRLVVSGMRQGTHAFTLSKRISLACNGVISLAKS